jgi:uncharacterized membrane protein
VIVGQSISQAGFEAFRWTESAGMVGLGDLPGRDFWSEANAITSSGAVIAGMSRYEAGREAFRWTESEGLVGLGDLPGGRFESQAQAASADGSVIVGYSHTDCSFEYLGEAFVWDAEHGMRNLRSVLAYEYGLDLTGWLLTEATGISWDGKTIAGNGFNPAGHGEAWVACLGCRGDLDDDGYRNVADFTLFAAAYGSKLGDADYNPAADLNGDGFVNTTDFTRFASVFGISCP